jgi:hypothetical protein
MDILSDLGGTLRGIALIAGSASVRVFGVSESEQVADTTQTTHQRTDRLGVAKVLSFFARVGWLFREQLTDDYGIDAQVEIADGHNALGALIGIQIKSGSSYFLSKLIAQSYFGPMIGISNIGLRIPCRSSLFYMMMLLILFIGKLSQRIQLDVLERVGALTFPRKNSYRKQVLVNSKL